LPICGKTSRVSRGAAQANSQGRKPTAVNIFSGHKCFPQL
jgi:hypothetical protein